MEALGDDVHAEVINGRPSRRLLPPWSTDARTPVRDGSRPALRSQPGGKWPGGWWFGTEVDVEYAEDQIFRHDDVGWRRDRVPQCPTGRPVRIRSDWAYELPSPSNEKRDLIDKLKVLHEAGVPHYWIGNPQNKTLVVHHWTEKGYLIVLTASSGETVRAEPFDAVELRVGVLFGDEDDDDE